MVKAGKGKVRNISTRIECFFIGGFMVNRALLKECIVAAIEVFAEVQKEKGIVFSSDEIVKSGISLFIGSSSRNGNGATPVKKVNGNGGAETQKSGSGNGGNGEPKVKQDDPATEKQVGFLKKHSKNIILFGLTKTKASELISGIRNGWSK